RRGRFCITKCRGNLTDRLARANLLGIDLGQARALLVAGDLALCGVLRRDGQVRRGADLICDRRDPLDQLLDPPARRNRLRALADSASSSGRKLRSTSWTAIARSVPAIPMCTWSPKVLFRQTT